MPSELGRARPVRWLSPCPQQEADSSRLRRSSCLQSSHLELRLRHEVLTIAVLGACSKQIEQGLSSTLTCYFGAPAVETTTCRPRVFHGHKDARFLGSCRFFSAVMHGSHSKSRKAYTSKTKLQPACSVWQPPAFPELQPQQLHPLNPQTHKGHPSELL